MKAIHLNDLLRAQGLPHSPFAEPRSGMRAALMLLLEMLRLVLALGLAGAALAFNLLFCEEEK